MIRRRTNGARESDLDRLKRYGLLLEPQELAGDGRVVTPTETSYGAPMSPWEYRVNNPKKKKE